MSDLYSLLLNFLRSDSVLTSDAYLKSRDRIMVFEVRKEMKPPMLVLLKINETVEPYVDYVSKGNYKRRVIFRFNLYSPDTVARLNRVEQRIDELLLAKTFHKAVDVTKERSLDAGWNDTLQCFVKMLEYGFTYMRDEIE